MWSGAALTTSCPGARCCVPPQELGCVATLALAPATDQHTCVCSLLWQCGMTRAAPESCRYLYTSSWRADCNRASLTRVHRQTYARLYPILLVKQDGSTIHIRYPEPRRILTMPVDLDSLSPEERRARFRKREGQLKEKKEEPELADDFDVEQYKQFWTKK